MTKLYRVRGRGAQLAFRRSNCRARTADLGATYVPQASGLTPQLAFAIPRKVGTAVTRNRIRRVLKDHLAGVLHSGDGATLIQIRPGASAKDSGELRLQTDELIRRLRAQATSLAEASK